ncbi:Uncharacterized protein APZ42_000867 [Daphnia magna]|uniref:Uncharacterized protein n=1 Tax=Daphnia magna TaxID=35525 RepID=A0A164JBS4_9CRUS|nr:Uncharacterized protein APZ42_000867 [Daphnia magna]
MRPNPPCARTGGRHVHHASHDFPWCPWQLVHTDQPTEVGCQSNCRSPFATEDSGQVPYPQVPYFGSNRVPVIMIPSGGHTALTFYAATVGIPEDIITPAGQGTPWSTPSPLRVAVQIKAIDFDHPVVVDGAFRRIHNILKVCDIPVFDHTGNYLVDIHVCGLAGSRPIRGQVSIRISANVCGPAPSRCVTIHISANVSGGIPHILEMRILGTVMEEGSRSNSFQNELIADQTQ